MATKKEIFWYIDRIEADTSLSPNSSTGVIALVEKSTNAVTRNGYSTEYTSISEAGTNNLRIYYIGQDSDLAVGTLTGKYTNIPDQFHEVIVSKVIANGYKDPRNMEFNNAQFFDQEYNLGVKEAKKFARSDFKTVGSIRPQDF
jgi:hypothetical protein